MKKIKHVVQGLSLILFSFLLIACSGDEEEVNSVSIEFVSAEPSTITIAGTGGAGRSETSTVSFRVKDPLGVVLAEQLVEFELSTSLGDISIRPASGTSDVNGLVSTVVQSGTIPTPVRVIARIPGTDISTQSDQLSVSSGIPDQNSASISSEINNPEAFNYEGTEVIFTMRLADAFNNPVPTGTSVTFTTEGGSIDGSCETEIDGSCSVTWRSQNPRPIGGDGDGMVTVLATALGQESFVDVNGNGLFDSGDSFTDIGEAFLDENNNGICDAGEPFRDLNGNNICDVADGLYNGTACQPGYSLCSSQTSVHVRSSKRIVMSTSSGNITVVPEGPYDVSAGSISIEVTIADLNGNSMPGNSSIEVTASNGEIQNGDLIPSVIETSRLLPRSFTVILGGDDEPSSDGTLNIGVTSPNGTETVLPIFVTD